MELIKGITLKPFTQTVWVNNKAKNIWEVPIKKISHKVNDLELESVVEGQRKCTWQTINREDLPSFTKKVNDLGLICSPIRYVGSWFGFSHVTPPIEKGKPVHVYLIVGENINDINKFRDAHFSGDHNVQGEMLGFPKCCTDYFTKVWAKGYVDPIWQTALNTQDKSVGIGLKDDKDSEITVDNSHPFSNPILRYLGIRGSFHIPCSFNCEDTIKIVTDRFDLIKDEKMKKTIISLLSMPMSWDCYHGIAIIKTPIFYIMINSMPTENKYIVKVNGDFIPRESERGINFPFNKVKQ